MGNCLSTTVSRLDDTARPYSAPWSQPALAGGMYSGALGASSTSAAPAYTTTANVGLGRGDERRVFLHDNSPGGPQLPRIEEDQALQGGDVSPVKPQQSGRSSQSPGGRRQVGPVNWTRGELIGQGAFGSVYLGMDSDTGQLMAVKQVNISKVAERGKIAEHIKGLEAEVHLLQQLNHPNIVRYLGTETTDGALNIFLEYVPGGSIASLLAKFGSFRESVIKVYTKQILLGLEYLHNNGIMHRDIKGANILVDNTGLVKLADFGASKKIEGLVTIDSGHKSVKGTPYWMAPEVITQTGHGRQADIWSVACTVIEMATGKPPWSQCGSQVSAMFQIAQSKGPPMIPETLSADCKDFLYLCFNRNWKDRPSASRLLQHPFLADVVCRTVAAPLNNIANVVQEPAIKAWRLPKDVRVPSPMREESEGAPFSTPSPMHPRMQEKKVGGGGGAARISIATSQTTSAVAGDGDQTPGSRVELPLSPLGQHMAPGRRDFAAPLAAAVGLQQQQQQRSPAKRSAVRSSAPVFGGYAAAALGPVAPLEPLDRVNGVVGNSQASTVHPRAALGDSRQEAPSSGPPTRQSSLGMDATLRVSNGSLRLSREPSAAAALAAAAGEGGQPQAQAAEVAGQQLETPVTARKAAPELVQLPDSSSQGPVGQEANTPSTADSRGTYKSDYNPMEEPSWLHPNESPLQASPLPSATGDSPNKALPAGGSQLGARAVAQLAVPEPARPPQQAQQPPQQHTQQQHMVWMDDDGSIDALPWDMGSWSAGSGDVSPGAGAAPQQAGEPVGQDVLISALNRRAQLEVRASLALFESTMSRLNGNGEATPPPPKPSPPRPAELAVAAAAAAPTTAPLLRTSLATSGAKLAAALCKEDLTALVDHPLAPALAAADTDKRRSVAPAPAAFHAPGALEEGSANFGVREAVWEQELSKELRQLPSQWRYQSGSRRMSMHGSPQKAPHQ